MNNVFLFHGMHFVCYPSIHTPFRWILRYFARLKVAHGSLFPPNATRCHLRAELRIHGVHEPCVKELGMSLASFLASVIPALKGTSGLESKVQGPGKVLIQPGYPMPTKVRTCA